MSIDALQRLLALFCEVFIIDASAEQVVELPIIDFLPGDLLLFQFFQDFDLFVELGIALSQIRRLMNLDFYLRTSGGYGSSLGITSLKTGKAFSRTTGAFSSTGASIVNAT